MLFHQMLLAIFMTSSAPETYSKSATAAKPKQRYLNFIVRTVPIDGIAPLGAKSSAC